MSENDEAQSNATAYPDDYGTGQRHQAGDEASMEYAPTYGGTGMGPGTEHSVPGTRPEDPDASGPTNSAIPRERDSGPGLAEEIDKAAGVVGADEVSEEERGSVGEESSQGGTTDRLNEDVVQGQEPPD